jgi:hypothetical protein
MEVQCTIPVAEMVDKGGGMYYDNNGEGMCQLKQPQQWWWRVLG